MAITDQLCRSFLDLWFHFDPAAATAAGEPGHDGRLGAFDPDAVRAHVAALRSISFAVEELEIEETADEIDRTALLDHLRVLLFRFEKEQPHRRDPSLWIEHACLALDGLLALPASDPGAAASALERLKALPRFLTDARDSLRKPPLLFVEAALDLLEGLAVLVDAAGRRFGGAWAAAGEEGPLALGQAEDALDRMELALRGEIEPNPDPGAAAIGEAEVDRRLHYEHASIHNAGEVWRASLRLATEVEQQVTALAAALDPAAPWRDVYERYRGPAGARSDLVSRARDALETSRRFAEGHGLAAPGVAPLETAPAPSWMRVLEPIACYVPAGERGPAVLRLAAADPVALPWLAARYGYPGVHFHHARCDALPGLVRRYISASSTPSGWGVYAEELMGELGYGAEPELRLAERLAALRDAHLAVVDLGLHTRQFTPEEAIGHLTAHLPVDRRTAEADVRRVACRPISGCAAMLGRGELRRLRDDIRSARGGALSPAAFHAEVLAYGGLPVPLIRWGMGLDG
ncbi:MAG TPA: DUF885 family protein [Gemmatimonadales bacterium]|nr:DUF885 family protein [Gemmatimonadales bacterium]